MELLVTEVGVPGDIVDPSKKLLATCSTEWFRQTGPEDRARSQEVRITFR